MPFLFKNKKWMLKNNECIITNRTFPEENWPMTSYGGDALAEGHRCFLFSLKWDASSQPQKCCHTQLQEDVPVLGNCCCWGVSILRKRGRIPGVPVPQWIARFLFERWSFQVSSYQRHSCWDAPKLAVDGNCSHFAVSCISWFWIS